MEKKAAFKELGQALLTVVKSELKSSEVLEIALSSGLFAFALLRGKGPTAAATHLMGPLRGPLRFFPGNIVRIVLILGGVSLLCELLEKAEAHLEPQSDAWTLSQNIRSGLKFVDLHSLRKNKSSAGI